MSEETPVRRYVRPAGRFECCGSDGSTGVLNAVFEFERSPAMPARPAEPIGWVLFWRGKRVRRIAKGRYQTRDGVELRASNPKAP